MPEQQHPGVYIDEIARGPRPIEGVPTSTAAILGTAERGSTTPRLVSSYGEYQRWFGKPFGEGNYLPQAVRGFFENGGRRAYICRLAGAAAQTAEFAFGDSVVRAAGPGAWGNRVLAKISAGRNGGLRLQVAYWEHSPAPAFDPFTDRVAQPRPDVTEEFHDLRAPYTLPGRPTLVSLLRQATAPPEAQPADGLHLLEGGTDSASLDTGDFEKALAELELEAYRDIALLYAPAVATDVARLLVAHCEKVRFRFAVIDAAKGQSTSEVLQLREAMGETSYAALYYPWLVTTDAQTGARRLTPPGGHVLGIYARTDEERGVFKAPANEPVAGAIGLEFGINVQQQDVLNPKGVNTIRQFPGRGIRVWGARTATSNALWKYVNVRRLFLFIERSLYEGTQWVVFEPNDEPLWERLADQVRTFLSAQWRLGALAGRKEEEAFFVKCDRTTMSLDDLANGRLICLVGIAPLKAAEFILLRISHQTAAL